jgi:carbamoylphosphate synthase small subunit
MIRRMAFAKLTLISARVKRNTSFSSEICFNTGMTGYQEIFTDPSYFGQIVVMNNVHVGNYGIEASEVESDSIKISGMICKKFNDGFSRKRAQQSLQDYFFFFVVQCKTLIFIFASYSLKNK